MCKQLLWSNECTRSNQALPPPLYPQLSSMHWALYNKTLKHNSKHETGDIMTNVPCTTSQLPTLLGEVGNLSITLPPFILMPKLQEEVLCLHYSWLSVYWSSLVSIECCPLYLHYWGCCLPLSAERTGPGLNTPYLCRWGEYQYH